MAVEVGAAYVSIVPSARDFGRKLSSDIGSGVDTAGRDSGKRFGGGFLAAAKSAIGPLTALFAAGAVKDFLGDAFSEARESQKVGALTTQVIKSTGGAAKVTAAQVGDLSTAISNKTGIDDEAIQSASNLLLTFTNVRNEVGKGNDVFDQATQIATDMSAALGGDPKDAAIQLGKALNDPVKGITALSRVGVSFTKEQKDQIATLVKSGKTVDAQKVILGELSREFGGAAEASATAGDKFATTFANFKEDIGTALLPLVDSILEKAAGFLGILQKKVFPAVGGLFDFITKGDITGSLLEAFGLQEDDAIVATFVHIRDTIVNVFKRARDVVGGFFGFLASGDITGSFLGALGIEEDDPIVGALVTTRDKAIEIIDRIKGVIGGLFTFISTGDVTGGLLNALGISEDDPIIGAIVKIRDTVIGRIGEAKGAVEGFFKSLSGQDVAADGPSGGVVGVFEKVGGFLRDELPRYVELARAAFSTIVEFIVTQVVPRIESIRDAVIEFVNVAIPIIQQFVDGMRQRFDQILPQLQKIFGTVGEIVKGALDLVLAIVQAVTSAISFVWENWGEGIMNVVTVAWQNVVGIISPILDIILGVIHTFTAIFRGDWEGVWTGIQEVVKGAIDLVYALIVAGLNVIQLVLSAAWSGIQAIAATAWDQIKQAIVERAQGIIDFITGLPAQIGTAFDSLDLVEAGKSLIDGFINGIKERAGGVITAIRETITDALPDFVKSALGIASPSKVFAKLGQFTAEGMALGLQQGAPRVQRAADSLVPSLVPPSFGALAPIPAGVGAGAATGGGAAVEQHFHGNIVSPDYREFKRETFEDARRAGLSRRGTVVR